MSEFTRNKAAQYIRMSTDAQDLSPEMQSAAIARYAASNGLSVIETYLDAGRSGLTLHKRPAMKKLLSDVSREGCPFSKILVYDISRWGRFQDTDASAYYEYHCRLHGVSVLYVEEPLSTVDSPMGGLLKGLKRAMAAEFSRELAVKTRAGQNSALDRGLHMGSLPCLGISRLAVSKRGDAARELGPFEHKAFSREHVRWIRGPESEVKLVQEIFRRYAYSDVSYERLARQLKAEGHVARNGRPITRYMLESLLGCEAFVGNFVWGRWDKGRRRRETEEHFRRISGALDPIIEPDLWQAVQAKRQKRTTLALPKEQLLRELRQAASTGLRITGFNLRRHGLACACAYKRAFGSLQAAFDLAGIKRHSRSAEESRMVAHRRQCGWLVCAAVVRALKASGIECAWPGENDGCTLTFVLATGARVRVHAVWRALRNGEHLWHMYKVYGESFDHVVVARHDTDDAVRDCLLLNRDDYFRHPVWFDGDAPPATFSGYLSGPEVLSRFLSMRPIVSGR